MAASRNGLPDRPRRSVEVHERRADPEGAVRAGARRGVARSTPSPLPSRVGRGRSARLHQRPVFPSALLVRTSARWPRSRQPEGRSGPGPGAAEPHLAKSARDGNAFAAVNAAFLEDGALVRIPARTAVAHPIHLVFLSEPAFGPTVSHPRNLVIAEAGSQAHIVETYVGIRGRVLHQRRYRDRPRAGAVLDHSKLQHESDARPRRTRPR